MHATPLFWQHQTFCPIGHSLYQAARCSAQSYGSRARLNGGQPIPFFWQHQWRCSSDHPTWFGSSLLQVIFCCDVDAQAGPRHSSDCDCGTGCGLVAGHPVSSEPSAQFSIPLQKNWKAIQVLSKHRNSTIFFCPGCRGQNSAHLYQPLPCSAASARPTAFDCAELTVGVRNSACRPSRLAEHSATGGCSREKKGRRRRCCFA